MKDDCRTHRTIHELEAGLREKILAWRRAANAADEILAEIEVLVKEKDLDPQFAWYEA